MRTWSYRKITATAETCIKIYTRKAEQAGDDKFIKQVHLDWAYGAFALWDEITRGGTQKDEDKVRLRALAMALTPEES